jgi:hypothetical protein
MATPQQELGPVLFCFTAGPALVYLFGWTARHRWGAEYPDLVTMIAWRKRPPAGSGLTEWLLFHLLSKARWTGILFIAAGVHGVGHLIWPAFPL